LANLCKVLSISGINMENPRNLYASIDARFRNWDVLPGSLSRPPATLAIVGFLLIEGLLAGSRGNP
jgi:hypothetical protein